MSDAAHGILAAFDQYEADFRRLTRRAGPRFEGRDWLGAQHDSAERLGLHGRAVRATVEAVCDRLGDRARDRPTWHEIHAAYADSVACRGDAELARTFFNSVARRVLRTVGFDPDVEFAGGPVAPPPSWEAVTEVFTRRGTLTALAAEVLARHPFSAAWRDLDEDAALAARAIEAQLGGLVPDALEMARPVFFRNKGAYLVGRVLHGERATPLVLALLDEEGRVAVDAALVGEDAMSRVFSYTHSYFFVDVERPGELVSFLHALMPHKPVAELYNALGFDRHGKGELYRALLRHLDESEDRFEAAPGARGMVMIVFALPSYDVVFKVIRDCFDEPKTTTREEVVAKYNLVHAHDRAGRLVDAQEFEYLVFDRSRFSEPLLAELTRQAARTVVLEGDRVVIRHLYAERRVVPLDLYLRDAGGEAARRAILDYGESIRDLASTNVFPGDLLLKNFGVTRLGRVVFYDYDEVCLVTDCRFREMPRARSDEEETAGEAWFYVGERDIFPEEIFPFLGLKAPLRDVFLWAHGDLLTPGFWWRMQEEHRAGHVLDLFPYGPEKRLRRP